MTNQSSLDNGSEENAGMVKEGESLINYSLGNKINNENDSIINNSLNKTTENKLSKGFSLSSRLAFGNLSALANYAQAPAFAPTQSC